MIHKLWFRMSGRLLLAALLLLPAMPGSAAPAPEKWRFWDVRDDAATATVDHSGWQKVLDKHLQPGTDSINRFAYEDVTAESRAVLTNYLSGLSTLDPRSYGAAEQQAYWINLYNALTVDLVLNYPNKKSILRMGKKFFSIGPWDDEVFEVAGQKLTLNDIEHRILRPIYQDHRVHYAVNCASIGCPNLAARAFTGALLEDQLAAQERAYISHERGVRFDKRGRLVLSQIYDWYGDDFGADEQAVVAHLAARHPQLGERLQQYTGKVRYDYDWSLNSTEPR